jgi:ABC-type multidrug transport system ATPase subunit
MIELTKLRKEFDDLVAVEDLTLTIPSGEIYGLIGPNGAGKTTTTRMICGLLEPTQGKVRVAEIDVLGEPEVSREGRHAKQAPLWNSRRRSSPARAEARNLGYYTPPAPGFPWN